MAEKMNTEKERNDESRKSETKKGPYEEKDAAHKGTMEQNKCTMCGRTFSNQSELRDHNKTVHNMETPEKTQGHHDSSIRGQTANRGEEKKGEMDEKERSGVKDKDEKMSEGSSNTSSKSTGSEWKDRESGQGRGDTAMGKSYGSGTDPKAQNQCTCQRCGEKCSSKDELDRHNKTVHGVEPGKKEESPKGRY